MRPCWSGALPPGESGFFSASDQARYEAAELLALPDHAGRVATPHGTPVEPRPGVRIYRDAKGVPLIYGNTGYDVWYGAGYDAAMDRLDAIRRLGEGRLAELTGSVRGPRPRIRPAETRRHRDPAEDHRLLPLSEILGPSKL